MSSDTTEVQTDVTGLSGRYATALFELADGAAERQDAADAHQGAANDVAQHVIGAGKGLEMELL